jgi:tetraacyldisaccharide-1-P 4'-kinase
LLTRCDLAGADAVGAARALLGADRQAPGLETPPAAVGRVVAKDAVTAPGALRGARVGALSGLAHNAAFAATLQEQGAQVVWHAARRDHHVWRAAELKRAAAAAVQRGASCLVTTEKDRVKMAAPLLAASHLSLPLLSLRIELQFLQGETEFVQMVLAAAKGNGS